MYVQSVCWQNDKVHREGENRSGNVYKKERGGGGARSDKTEEWNQRRLQVDAPRQRGIERYVK